MERRAPSRPKNGDDMEVVPPVAVISAKFTKRSGYYWKEQAPVAGTSFPQPHTNCNTVAADQDVFLDQGIEITVSLGVILDHNHGTAELALLGQLAPVNPKTLTGCSKPRTGCGGNSVSLD